MHNHYIGGGFGRRLEVDMALTAVRIAQHVDGPVKVTWSREQDLRQDIFRPCYRNLIDASLADGKLAAFDYKVCGSSILARWAPPFFQNGIDGDAIDSAADTPYDVAPFARCVSARGTARHHDGLVARRRV